MKDGVDLHRGLGFQRAFSIAFGLRCCVCGLGFFLEFRFMLNSEPGAPLKPNWVQGFWGSEAFWVWRVAVTSPGPLFKLYPEAPK